MAHSLSARKRVRQNVKRRAINRARRSTLKTKLRKSLEILAGTDAAAAETAVREASRMLDKFANQRTVHRNAAARRKSRLARRLNALKQKATG